MSDSNLLAPAGNISKEIAVGSRNSELALKQTHSVISLIKKHHPDKKLRLVSMSTTGDKIIHIALPKIGEKSLFTKELEVALLAKEVQFVVHSLKDLPTTLPEGLVLGAILKREDPRDAVIMQKKFQGEDLSSLPRMSTIGTSSLRRKSQLLSRFPHLKVESIRGNLNTRLRKLEEGNQFSAIVLAMAGLSRMGWESKVSKVLLESEMMYAVGQGALAVECVEEDTETLNMLSVLHHRDTALQVVAERSFLSALGGGCSAPVGVVSRFRDDGVILELEGGVWSLDGVKMLRKKLCCSVKERVIETMPRKKLAHSQPIVFCGIVSPVPDVDLYKTAYKLGQDLAAALLSEGASAIMEEARKANESS